AQNFNQFQDLFLLAENLYGKRIRGNRLAAVSGAGFEAVGMADSILSDDYAMQLTTLAPQTVDALRDALAAKKLDTLVGITNPLDINPAADDELHAQAAATLANDPAVDAVIIGLDPLSPAMHTLAATDVPAFDLKAPASIVRLLPEVAQASDKPIIGVIDGGRLYDPLRDALMAAGVPVFPVCDRAVAALAQYIQARLHADVLRGGVRE
ncbi:MAG: CoA-binding protein, partial [Deltaproteobacteria bacterium]|nr:CoA-binding protein [Deltaproteobacteria bacterium]